ncbi:MAG TPA: hypothetical protein VGD43_01790, partial [Micromonospora sp.]
KAAWDWVKSTSAAVWDWLTSLPGKLKTAFAKISGYITAPFRAAFNFVARAWNNTIGKLSWTVPGWVPFGLGGQSISAPKLPEFHTGGRVPGAPGTEVPILAMAGERVTPPGRSDVVAIIEFHSTGSRLDDLLMEVVSNSVRVRSRGNVQLAFGKRR